MNQKKSTKILMILIVVVFIIILLGGFVFAYLATDIFRSEKDLFFKYITQIGDFENGFIDNQLKEYFEKRKNTPYNDEGNFSVNITAENGQEEFENINNFNITYSGQIDEANSKAEQNISINYSDEVKFPVSYKQIGNTIGLQTKYVGSKYIAVETDNLENITDEEFEVPEISIINNIGTIELTEEQEKHIKNTYMGILDQQLGEEKFSKVEELKQKGYKLSLTGEDVKTILIQLLESFKNDQTTIDILNKHMESKDSLYEISTTAIGESIKSINSKDFSKQNIEITVYGKNGQTNKIELFTTNGSFYIERIKEDNKLKLLFYYKPIEGIKGKFNISATFEGLDSMQNIKEVYESEIQFEQQPSIIISKPEEKDNEENSSVGSSELIQYKYQFENNIAFTDNENIEEFTSDNSMILTNYESEQVSNFLSAVGERLKQVNKQQMEELGLEESENPIQYLIPSIGIYNMAINSMEQTTMSEAEINTFNSKFENYEGTNQQAQTVKGLLSTISRNNENEENDDMKITELNFNGEEYDATEENIATIKNNMNMEKNYRIEFEKDSDTGLVFRAVINER